jgi:two-component system response regulator MprA
VAYFLVADDDPVMLMQVREALESCQYRVRAAADGEQALDLMADGPPAAIFLDSALPDLDVPHFLTELRRSNGWAQIPVVLMGSDQELRNAGRLPVQDYLLRPLSMRGLSAALDTIELLLGVTV